jgi:O-6-methylguanine DNA methyltransferase
LTPKKGAVEIHLDRRGRTKKRSEQRSHPIYRRAGSTGEVSAGKQRLRVAWTHAGVAFIDDADVDVADVEKRLKMHFVEKRVPALIRSALAAVAKGARDVDVPIDLSWASEYIQEVLAAAMGIPRGQTRPYSWLAREARRPLAVRAAATAMAKNPLWLLVPCHRVIAADGTIGSYGSSGVERKRELLEREGVMLSGAKPKK